MDRITAERGNTGAMQSRLDSALRSTQSLATHLESADSLIRSADVASDVAELVRLQIMQQVISAVLAQANQEPSLVLKLLYGVDRAA